MKRRSAMGLSVVLLALFAVAAPAGAGEDELRLEVVVLAEETGKPIPYASVYVKYTEGRFLLKDKKLELSGKTNEEGKATIPGVRVGKVTVQVVAKGWKTFGRRYDLAGPKQTLEIKLKPAKKWY